jgi:hypothetical protein
MSPSGTSLLWDFAPLGSKQELSMIKKSLVLVAASLSAYAAIYGHEPPVLSSWIPAAASIQSDL